jgi:hypothetical protein
MKRACNLLIYRALEASVKKYADTIGKPRRNSLTDSFTLTIYMQFLVAADTVMGSTRRQAP